MPDKVLLYRYEAVQFAMHEASVSLGLGGGIISLKCMYTTVLITSFCPPEGMLGLHARFFNKVLML